MAEPVRTEVPSTGGVRLAAYRWDPDGAPRGIVQIVHGMGEHALRYAPVADAATARGYVVWAADQRGHGATAGSDDALGVLGEGGWEELVEDIGRVGAAAREAHPGLRLALVGHSMGSFAVQQFLLGHGDEPDVVVLSGTAAIDLLEPALDLDAPIDLSAFNAAFQPPRTDYDWLSRDDAEVDRYIADPLCGFGLDVPGGKAMFAGSHGVADPDRLARIPQDLPIHVTVGDMDPVNGRLALVNALVDRYRAAGLTEVTLQVWPGARHEVFNETNRAEVVADVLDRIDARMP